MKGLSSQIMISFLVMGSLLTVLSFTSQRKISFDLPSISSQQSQQKSEAEKLRFGVIGLVHTHVHWILGKMDRGDIEIVGIAEPNRDLAQRYATQHGFSMDIVYDNIEEMVEATHPEAVTAFNTIYGHLEVVEFCAPRGIHVMVEKPLAVNIDHARKMADIAADHGIYLLTNYETSWYGSTHAAYELTLDGKIGELRRMVFQTGHPGPVEIGCNIEFLEWLTDPLLNGGGALTDFGCYGTNIATWFLGGAKPLSVTCITQSIKPHLYPKVEDDATIMISYPQTQVIVQASWNWSHNRKDMTVYGTHGYVTCFDNERMEVMEDEEKGAYASIAQRQSYLADDPFSYFASVIRGDISLNPYSLYSIENNLRVMEILEMARLSSEMERTITWEEFLQILEE